MVLNVLELQRFFHRKLILFVFFLKSCVFNYFIYNGIECNRASSTTKTGRHDIAEILLKVALSRINQIKSNHNRPTQKLKKK
jgi:hypothetical protein